MQKIRTHRSQQHYFLKSFKSDGRDLRYQKPQSCWILSCKWWALARQTAHILPKGSTLGSQLILADRGRVQPHSQRLILESSTWSSISVLYCTFQNGFWGQGASRRELAGFAAPGRLWAWLPLCQQEQALPGLFLGFCFWWVDRGAFRRILCIQAFKA